MLEGSGTEVRVVLDGKSIEPPGPSVIAKYSVIEYLCSVNAIVVELLPVYGPAVVMFGDRGPGVYPNLPRGN